MITYRNRRVPETFEEIVDPNHTVLLVHEMRNDLREMGAPDKNGQMIRIEFDPIVEPIRRLVDGARRRSVRIIYAGYVGHSDENFYSDPMVLRSRDRLMDPATAPGPSGEVEVTRGWQVIDELRPQQGDIILRKPRVDCFIGTNLELVLRWNAIRTVVIVGVGAEIGILPTVFHAVNLGFFVVAPEDCIRPTAREWHDDAMKFIGGNCHGPVALVRPSADIVRIWGVK